MKIPQHQEGESRNKINVLHM